MKYSKQRDTILEIVQNSCEHPTAQMIYREAKEDIPNISLGTVYRNLNALYENNYIKRIAIPNDKDRFDKTLEEHSHIYCIICKKVFDIPNDLLNNIDEIISHRTGYEIVSKDLVFYGLCHECRKGREK